ncbi:NAD(P)-dependent oxidoreductase [Aliiroseovarius sediminis]|uniref:NAD(P)-dependent oxidoreductase n=1 Tax=Aliiroseovarius sediminis TaxID=2925839 RepID=UPI001F5984E2|nr:NAD(P)-dependent oxidoreductase [Aliiroseovarius sediminis]MCI2395038.1 hydroxyacid dehydrogenase [Aliiroseovarius sediminis]
MSKILITPRSLSKGNHPDLEPLRRAGFELVMPTPGATPTEVDLVKALPGCVGWLAGVEPVSEAVILSAKDLRVISRNGTGVDNLPLDAVEAAGIVIQRAEGTNARGVAELALALALAGLRNMVPTHTGVKAGDWPRRIGSEIQGAKVGIVGLGAIGATMAELCLAVGAHVYGFDPYAPDGVVTHPAFTRSGFTSAIAGAKVLSLHAPMQKDGRPLIGAQEIAALGHGGVIVNTARAGLVDEAALLEALESGQVSSYAADAFHTEPPELTALLRHPNVIATSHIGGFTDASVARSTRRAVDNLLNVLVSDAV